MGCGYAEINQHFKDISRFIFHNFDHHSDNELVISRDIKKYTIRRLFYRHCYIVIGNVGSKCKDYIQEAYRILDTCGTLLISVPYKRWNELDKEGKPTNRLIKILEEKHFNIIENQENKFMFIV